MGALPKQSAHTGVTFCAVRRLGLLSLLAVRRDRLAALDDEVDCKDDQQDSQNTTDVEPGNALAPAMMPTI